MKIAEFMSTKVERIAPGESAQEAWRRMQALRIHHLVVVDGGTVVGVLSDSDLAGARGGPWRANKTVAELMTRQTL